MPVVATLYKEKLEAAGVNVVGVSQFNTTEAETVAFVERYELTFPNIYDEAAQLAEAYGVRGVPTYIFLDKDGKIAHTSSGARGVFLIQSLLESLQEE